MIEIKMYTFSNNPEVIKLHISGSPSVIENELSKMAHVMINDICSYNNDNDIKALDVYERLVISLTTGLRRGIAEYIRNNSAENGNNRNNN